MSYKAPKRLAVSALLPEEKALSISDDQQRKAYMAEQLAREIARTLILDDFGTLDMQYDAARMATMYTYTVTIYED